MRSPKNAGRGRESLRRERKKARKQIRRYSGKYLPEENNVPTSEEFVEKTLGRLRILGNQIFGLSPFHEYFDDWMVNLRAVLSDFQSSPAISIDDQFLKDCSQILSTVERKLEEIRCKAVFYDAANERISDNRRLLERIDEEYANRKREIEGKKNSEIRRLSKNIKGFKGELDRINQMKTGIFRFITKKAKAKKEAEANKLLNYTQNERQLAMQNYTAEQEGLLKEYEERKHPIIEQIQNLQKEIRNPEIDESIEARRAACGALVSAVNACEQRHTLSLQ